MANIIFFRSAPRSVAELEVVNPINSQRSASAILFHFKHPFSFNGPPDCYFLLSLLLVPDCLQPTTPSTHQYQSGNSHTANIQLLPAKSSLELANTPAWNTKKTQTYPPARSHRKARAIPIPSCNLSPTISTTSAGSCKTSKMTGSSSLVPYHLR